MTSQDWEGKELDKDLLVPGNRLYSPETCIFISKKLNNLLGKKHKTDLPQGVTRYSKAKYQAILNGIKLGSYLTIEEASAVYKEAKLEYLYSIVAEQKNKKLITGLLAHIKLLEELL